MIIYYQFVIMMIARKKECNQSQHRVIVQDYSQEIKIPRKQSREDKIPAPIDRKNVQQITRHNKWMTGRSAVTLHR